MLVHGYAPAPNLHFRYAMPSFRSCLHWVVRLIKDAVRRLWFFFFLRFGFGLGLGLLFQAGAMEKFTGVLSAHPD
jgi:hypothetical protein